MSKLVLKDSRSTDEYRILLDVETENNKKYIVYTKDEEVKSNFIKAYASIYKYNNKTKKYTVTPIKNIKELDFVDKLLNSLQSESEN